MYGCVLGDVFDFVCCDALYFGIIVDYDVLYFVIIVYCDVHYCVFREYNISDYTKSVACSKFGSIL